MRGVVLVLSFDAAAEVLVDRLLGAFDGCV